MEIRTNKLNYNEDYRGARFYTFSTYADDLTSYFMSSSGTVVTPCAFLAFKVENYETLMPLLSTYFENKLAYYRKQYILDADTISSQSSKPTPPFTPLFYLLDLMKFVGAIDENTTFLLQDIAEQDFNGTFTDIICNIPHETNPKTLAYGVLNQQGKYILTNKDKAEENKEYEDKIGKASLFQLVENATIYEPTEITYKPSFSFGGSPFESKTPATSKDIQVFVSLYILPANVSENSPIYAANLSVYTYDTTSHLEGKLGQSTIKTLTKTKYKCGDKFTVISGTYKRKDTAITKVLISCLSTNAEPQAVRILTPAGFDETYLVESGTNEYEISPNLLSSEVIITVESAVLNIETILVETCFFTVSAANPNTLGFFQKKDTLLGWESAKDDILYDSYQVITDNSFGFANNKNGYGIYCFENPPEVLIATNAKPEKTFSFNCIIPLYQEYNVDTQMVNYTEFNLSNSLLEYLDLTKFKPYGIWLNRVKENTDPKDLELVTISTDGTYSSSWSLSITSQIKPYYASNSVPVTYASNTDIENSMQLFSGVLNRMQELSRVVQKLSKQVSLVAQVNSTSELSGLSQFSFTELQKKLQECIDKYTGIKDLYCTKEQVQELINETGSGISLILKDALSLLEDIRTAQENITTTTDAIIDKKLQSLIDRVESLKNMAEITAEFNKITARFQTVEIAIGSNMNSIQSNATTLSLNLNKLLKIVIGDEALSVGTSLLGTNIASYCLKLDTDSLKIQQGHDDLVNIVLGTTNNIDPNYIGIYNLVLQINSEMNLHKETTESDILNIYSLIGVTNVGDEAEESSNNLTNKVTQLQIIVGRPSDSEGPAGLPNSATGLCAEIEEIKTLLAGDEFDSSFSTPSSGLVGMVHALMTAVGEEPENISNNGLPVSLITDIKNLWEIVGRIPEEPESGVYENNLVGNVTQLLAWKATTELEVQDLQGKVGYHEGLLEELSTTLFGERELNVGGFQMESSGIVTFVSALATAIGWDDNEQGNGGLPIDIVSDIRGLLTLVGNYTGQDEIGLPINAKGLCEQVEKLQTQIGHEAYTQTEELEDPDTHEITQNIVEVPAEGLVKDVRELSAIVGQPSYSEEPTGSHSLATGLCAEIEEIQALLVGDEFDAGFSRYPNGLVGQLNTLKEIVGQAADKENGIAATGLFAAVELLYSEEDGPIASLNQGFVQLNNKTDDLISFVGEYHKDNSEASGLCADIEELRTLIGNEADEVTHTTASGIILRINLIENLAQSVSEDLYKEDGLVAHVVALDELNLPNVVENLEQMIPMFQNMETELVAVQTLVGSPQIVDGGNVSAATGLFAELNDTRTNLTAIANSVSSVLEELGMAIQDIVYGPSDDNASQSKELIAQVEEMASRGIIPSIIHIQDNLESSLDAVQSILYGEPEDQDASSLDPAIGLISKGLTGAVTALLAAVGEDETQTGNGGLPINLFGRIETVATGLGLLDELKADKSDLLNITEIVGHESLKETQEQNGEEVEVVTEGASGLFQRIELLESENKDLQKTISDLQNTISDLIERIERLESPTPTPPGGPGEETGNEPNEPNEDSNGGTGDGTTGEPGNEHGEEPGDDPTVEPGEEPTGEPSNDPQE